MSEVAENNANELQIQTNANNKFKSYKISWVGYVKPASITFIFLVIFLSCIAGGNFNISFLFLIPTLYFAYYTYYQTSIRLYTNMKTEFGVIVDYCHGIKVHLVLNGVIWKMLFILWVLHLGYLSLTP